MLHKDVMAKRPSSLSSLQIVTTVLLSASPHLDHHTQGPLKNPHSCSLNTLAALTLHWCRFCFPLSVLGNSACATLLSSSHKTSLTPPGSWWLSSWPPSYVSFTAAMNQWINCVPRMSRQDARHRSYNYVQEKEAVLDLKELITGLKSYIPTSAGQVIWMSRVVWAQTCTRFSLNTWLNYSVCFIFPLLGKWHQKKKRIISLSQEKCKKYVSLLQRTVLGAILWKHRTLLASCAISHPW